MDHYAHLQLQQTQFIPLTLWGFHRLLDSGRLRDGVLWACGRVSDAVVRLLRHLPGSVHGGRLRDDADREGGAVAGAGRRAVVAGAIVTVAMVPVGRAYLAARRVVGERRSDEIAKNSATWRNYLAPPEVNVVYGKVFARFMDPERRLFPGFVAIALALVGLWPRTRQGLRGFARAPECAYALGLILAFDVSLGFNGLIYRGLYDYFLPFKALRIPARMGLMVGFSLAILAGYGAARIAERLRSPTTRRAVLTLAGVLMLIEYASTPIELWAAPRQPPQVYADLVRDVGDGPTSVIFEFPTGMMEDPEYLYYSTFHWQNLVNGYSGFFPPSYVQIVNAVRTFPTSGRSARSSSAAPATW